MRRLPARATSLALTAFWVAGELTAQGASSLPHLTGAQLDPTPWNVTSGGIAAFDVRVDDKGAVTSAEVVQDMAPYADMLDQAVGGWRFEPAREGGRAVPSRVLVLGFFRPPQLMFAAPENPRYKGVAAPPELPWPSSVVVPPYPPNVLGSGRVVLEADISSHGLVTAARVLSPPGAFDSSAVQSLQQWKFRAAHAGNRDVASRAFVVVSFLGPTL